MNKTIVGVILVLVPLMGACSNLQKFTVKDISELEGYRKECRYLVRGPVTFSNTGMNLTLSENLQWGSPSHPKKGWRTDLTLEVEETLKGEVTDSRLTIRNLAPFSMFPSSVEPWPSLDSKEYYVGWKRFTGHRYSDLVLIPIGGRRQDE